MTTNRRQFLNLSVAATAIAMVIGGWLGAGQAARAATLEVGPGRPFARIEEANAKAQPGDLILVHPRQDGQPYERTTIFVRARGLTIRAVPSPGSSWVKISGKGFSYRGQGSIPRAVFQFEPGADHCVLEGFELCEAHNQSQNGAGVRINQANHVTIRNCSIHDNDMGVMSNGNGTLESAVDQRLEACEIHHNGNAERAGYNHNLYLGGTSATLRFCEVHHSLTGSNIKSRAHHTRVEYCYVHDSSNREFDLVDAPETARPESHAVLLGNVIVKDPECKGNHSVIHFGQDGGDEHDGTLHLVFNTIVTPFVSPVVDLSAPKAKVRMLGNVVSDGGSRQAGQKLAEARGGASTRNVTGMHNWFSGGFEGAGGTGLEPNANRFRRASESLFVNPSGHDYRLRPGTAKEAVVSLSTTNINLPGVPGMPGGGSERPLAWQYHHPRGKEERPAEKRLTLGAYGRQP